MPEDSTAPPWPPAQRSPEELKSLAEQVARNLEDYNRRACLVNWWKCEMSCAAWVKVDWLKIVEGVIGFVDLETSPQYAAGVAEGRRQATAKEGGDDEA